MLGFVCYMHLPGTKFTAKQTWNDMFYNAITHLNIKDQAPVSFIDNNKPFKNLCIHSNVMGSVTSRKFISLSTNNILRLS